jgi:hypothetical protein
MKIEQLLLSHGWAKKGSCHCNGSSKSSYELKTDDGVIKLLVRYSNFAIGMQGEKLKRHNINELQKTVDEIHKKYNQGHPGQTEI